jgi:moderate conductance mechanosensitive channel
MDLGTLPPWTGAAGRIGLVLLLAVAAYVVARAAITVGLRHLLDRRVDMGRGGASNEDRIRRVETIRRLAGRIAGAVIVVMAALMILGEFGVDVGPALAGLGVVGIAVGFGAQSLVRDWFAGIFVVIENQYSHGDVVRVAGVEGVVEDLSLRRTVLRDVDGSIHSVPNGQITVASNLTRLWTTAEIRVRLATASDAQRAVEAVERVGREMKLDPEWHTVILAAPSVARFGVDGTVEVTARVRATDEARVRAELAERVRRALTDAGIPVEG